MANIAATIDSVHLLEAPQSSGPGIRFVYRLEMNLGAMTAGDTASVTNVPTLINNFLQQGRTLTLRQTQGGIAGLTPGATAAYALIATVNGASLQFSVGSASAAAAVAVGTIVPLYVSVDETAI